MNKDLQGHRSDQKMTREAVRRTKPDQSMTQLRQNEGRVDRTGCKRGWSHVKWGQPVHFSG